MDAISPSYLVAIGILLIGLEAVIFSFVISFLGFALIIVAIISYFYTFDNPIIQLALASIIAFLTAFLLRNYILEKISKPSEEIESRAHISGVGYIDEDMIKFDGTYWKSDDDLSGYNNGDKVEVIDVVNNKVVLKEV